MIDASFWDMGFDVPPAKTYIAISFCDSSRSRSAGNAEKMRLSS